MKQLPILWQISRFYMLSHAEKADLSAYTRHFRLETPSRQYPCINRADIDVVLI